MQVVARRVPVRGSRFRPTVLLCEDDDADARNSALVCGACDFQVVARAALASEAIQMAAAWQPSVIILDLHLFGMSGLEVLPGLREAAPDASIVINTADRSATVRHDLSLATAVAYKDDPWTLGWALDRLQGRLRPSRLHMFEGARKRWVREVRATDTASVLSRLLDIDDLGRQVDRQLVPV